MEDEEEDDIEAIKRLKEEITWERDFTQCLRVSANQWRNFVRDTLSVTADIDQEEAEWRVRYNYQRSLNEKLEQVVKDLKKEIRVIRRGKGEESVPTKGDMAKMSLAECRIHTKHLQTDITSMKSIRSMYERQLDHEAVEYNKIKEKISGVLREIIFLQNSCMKQQESFERKYFSNLRDKYGGNLFHPSKLIIRRTRPDLTASRPSNNVFDIKKSEQHNTYDA